MSRGGIPLTVVRGQRRAPKLDALLAFDEAVLRDEAWPLVGIDEVGRGSLIGPIVAAAVIFPHTLPPEARQALQGLDDSKKLSANLRAALSAEIRTWCRVGVGQADREEVETLNVHHASLLAAYRAYEAVLSPGEAGFVLLDGRAVLPQLPPDQQQAVIKGDGLSAAIAAASVIAKHTRDTWVLQEAQRYPGYGWETNMGYGVPEHRQAIAQWGLTPHHRANFKTCQ